MAFFKPRSSREFSVLHQAPVSGTPGSGCIESGLSCAEVGLAYGPISAIHRALQTAMTLSCAIYSFFLDSGNTLWNCHILDPGPFTTLHPPISMLPTPEPPSRSREKPLSRVVQSGPMSNSTTKGGTSFTCPGYTQCTTHYSSPFTTCK